MAVAGRDVARCHELAQQSAADVLTEPDDDAVARSPVKDSHPTADQDVVSRIAVQVVVAGTADQHVGTVAAIGGELHACQTGRRDHVVTAETVDDKMVVGPEVGDRHSLRQARHRHHAIVGRDSDGVAVIGAVDHDRVGIGIRGTVDPGQVDIDLAGIGPGEIVDRDGVGAFEGGDIDRF